MTKIMSAKRFIGIRHRRKKTKDGEARPTTVSINSGGTVVTYDLETETDELDFLMGRLPTIYRKVDPTDVLHLFSEEHPGGYRPHQLKTRKFKEDDDLDLLPPSHLIDVIDGLTGKPTKHVITKVPTAFEGLRAGDRVGMVMGGSGDNFASALSRRGEDTGAEVYQIPPYALINVRGLAEKDDDHRTLADLVENKLNLFHLLRRRGREAIRVKHALRLRQDAQQARIGCELQLHAALVGRIFLSEEGKFPEGLIKDQYDLERASDKILQGYVAEEKRREKELKQTVEAHPLWEAIFEPIKGVGQRLAAGILGPIGLIERFWVDPEQMEALYLRSRELERRGEYHQDLRQVTDQLTPEMTIWNKLKLVAAWQRLHGKAVQAALLDEALQCHWERGRLLGKGAAKLKKFCGVHVITHDADGEEVPTNRQFARRRAGQVANWSPQAKQTLFLLSDQFNRRPDSYWGAKLRENKAKLRAKHPEAVEELVEEVKGGKKVMVSKKRYTDGHIHKMAIWRTLSQFVVSLFKVWTRIEEEAERERRAALTLEIGADNAADTAESNVGETEAAA